MSALVISIPGKSFLAGEYLAVKGGPSLIFASEPRFVLHAHSGRGQLKGVPAESPAAKLIADHPDFFKNYDLEFSDPHQGRGGWGASTAQFLAAFVLNEWREACALESLKSLSFSRVLESYWRYAWSGKGQRPSGADVIGQYMGALTYFDPESARLSVTSWPFHEIDFGLIPTGRKVATHEHLQTLQNFETDELRKVMGSLWTGLQQADEKLFVGSVNEYARVLESLKFVAPSTQEILRAFGKCPQILASKGCGALGADVVLAVFAKQKRAEIDAFLQTQGLSILATSKDLSSGLDLQNRG